MNGNNLYERIAKVYDLIDMIYFRRQESSPRTAVLQQIENGDKILDICTGTATTPIQIAKARKEAMIAGIDRSKEMLQIAKKKIKSERIKNIKLYQMDATQLKIPDRCFDKVLISLVLHEVEENIAESIILEAGRVLKDSGRIIVTEWNKPQNSVKDILFFSISIAEPKSFRSFIKKDMEAYFKKYGLEIDHMYLCDYSKVMVLRKTESN